MQEVNGYTASIASAVEQQGAATSDISRSVQQAAQGTGAVTSNMSRLATTVESTSAAADNVLSASGAMSQNTDALREEKPVKTFHAEHDPNVVIFGISAVTVEEGEPSVLVLGADAGSGQPSVVLQLMYLERGQFAGQPGAGEATELAVGEAAIEQAADKAPDNG